MIFLLNLIGFIIEMIVCPILMIPFLLWRLIMSIEIKEPDPDTDASALDATAISSPASQLLTAA